VSYMSPEQVRAKELDARTDLFSFDIVLYEMATGQLPCRGSSVGEICGSILHTTPAPALRLNPELPPELERIAGKCLEKDRNLRYQHAADLCADLQRFKRDTDSGLIVSRSGTAVLPQTVPPRKLWKTAVSVVAVIAVLIAGALYYRWHYAKPVSDAVPHVARIRQLTDIGTVATNMKLLLAGSRIYFTATEKGELKIKYVSPDGGPLGEVQKPFLRTELFDVAPSGNELLIAQIEVGYPAMLWRRSMWRLPLSSGTPERVGSVFAADAAWSPDGRTIVYSSEENLNLVDADGNNSRKLASTPGRPFRPRWSPDGKLIRASVLDIKGGGISLWEFDVAGKVGTRMLADWDDSNSWWAGNWTADGRYYVFIGSQGGPRNVWVLGDKRDGNPPGRTRPVRLTDSSFRFSLPVPSRDGKTIYAVGWQPHGQLTRYDSRAHEFKPYLEGLSADHVSFSHDGKWIAYLSYPEATVVTSRLDGSQPIQLTFAPMRAFLPRWSPDDSEIGFTGSPAPGKPTKVYLVPARGGVVRPFAPGIGGEQSGPDWLKDGESLLMTAADESGTYYLHAVELKTGKDTILPGTADMSAGTVSPDGRSIVAIAGLAQSLVLFDIASHSTRLLAQVAAYPYWSADGKYVYYSTLMTGNLLGSGGATVYRVRVSDVHTERLLPTIDFPLVGNSGNWSGPAADGSPLLLRELGTSNVYALDLDAPLGFTSPSATMLK